MSDLRWLDDAEDPARIALRRGLDESERFAHSELRQRRVWARVSDPARTFRAARLAFVRGALAASALTAVAIVAVKVAHVEGERGEGGPGVARSAATGAAETNATAEAATQVAVVAAAGAVVETREGERMVRLLPRGARAEIAPHTLMSVDAQGRPELRRGEIRFSVTPSTAKVATTPATTIATKTAIP